MITTMSEVSLQDWVAEQLSTACDMAKSMLDFIHLNYSDHVCIIHTVVAATRTLAKMQSLIAEYFNHGLITDHVREGVAALLKDRHHQIKTYHGGH